MENVTLHNHYLVAVSQAVERAGIDNRPLMQQAGFDSLLLKTAGHRVPLHQLVGYCRSVWAQLGDEHFGLSGQSCSPGSFAFLAEQCMSCRDLREVFRKAEAFYRLFANLRLELIETGGTVALRIERLDPLLDPDQLLVDFLLTTWHRFASWLSGAQVVLKQAEFTFAPPEHLHEYQYMFPTQHLFNCEQNALVFSAEYLDKPIIRDPAELDAFLENFPFSVLTPPEIDDSFAFKVRSLIKQSPQFPEVMPEFEQIAPKLNLTPSTLRRKLKAEGTSYQQIKDLLRRDLAIHHMQAESLSIGDIALRVGFTEAGAFIRAFKGWTGITPGHYRSACA